MSEWYQDSNIQAELSTDWIDNPMIVKELQNSSQIIKQDIQSELKIDDRPSQSEPSNYFEETLLPSVFKHEAGYSTDIKDKGNYLNKDTSSEFIGTNFGISADELAAYLKRTPTADDMKALTKEDAKAIYKQNYYTSRGIDKLPQELQEIVFNGVVNSGSHAISVVQGLLGLEQDGVAGPKTLEAMKNAKFTKQEFKDALLAKYKTFKTWKEHGKGWTKRFEELAK